MSHARAACTVRGSNCAPPFRRFVRFGPTVHLRKFRTTPCCIPWPYRADVRSLHVKRASSTVAGSSRCLATEPRSATHGWPTHRSSCLAPRVAQCRSPNDPRHGLAPASVRRPGRPGSVAIDATRCQQARTSTPKKAPCSAGKKRKTLHETGGCLPCP
jgi:hypothetical protein